MISKVLSVELELSGQATGEAEASRVLFLSSLRIEHSPPYSPRKSGERVLDSAGATSTPSCRRPSAGR